jgi:EAL domain-containing protein (putative c-di-GMP-specific phosphodiesterase class I)
MSERMLRMSGLSLAQFIIDMTGSVALQDVAQILSVVEGFNLQGVAKEFDDFDVRLASLSYRVLMNPKS